MREDRRPPRPDRTSSSSAARAPSGHGALVHRRPALRFHFYRFFNLLYPPEQLGIRTQLPEFYSSNCAVRNSWILSIIDFNGWPYCISVVRPPPFFRVAGCPAGAERRKRPLSEKPARLVGAAIFPRARVKACRSFALSAPGIAPRFLMGARQVRRMMRRWWCRRIASDTGRQVTLRPCI